MDAGIVDMEIDLELLRAKRKHPEWPEDIVHQAAIVAEAAGETLKAANNYKYNGVSLEETLKRMKKEAIQTGAMAKRLLENLPGRDWEPVAPLKGITTKEMMDKFWEKRTKENKLHPDFEHPDCGEFNTDNKVIKNER